MTELATSGGLLDGQAVNEILLTLTFIMLAAAYVVGAVVWGVVWAAIRSDATDNKERRLAALSILASLLWLPILTIIAVREVARAVWDLVVVFRRAPEYLAAAARWVGDVVRDAFGARQKGVSGHATPEQ